MTSVYRRVMAKLVSPSFMLRFHMVATIVFLILIVPSMLWWANSVPYLVAISVWANLAGHLSAWQAARAEQKIDEEKPANDDARHRGEEG